MAIKKDAPAGKRILVFNVNWLGDVLFSTAAFKALRKAYPSAYIGCVVHPRAKEILEGNPNINEIIIFDEKEKDKHLINKFKFISDIKKKKFDTVYLFHRSFTRLMLMVLADIPRRIGYRAKKRSSLFLTKIIPVPKASMHRVEYFLNILRACDIPCDDGNYEFFLDSNSRKKIRVMLESQGVNKDDFVITLNPGGNWMLKRWVPEYYAQLANVLIQKYKARIIITGSANDLPLAQYIASKIETKPIIACGKTTLKELGALLERSNLFISADSGPVHIAASLGVPIVALFGPTSPQVTGPLGKGKIMIIHKDIGCVIPCYKVDCKDNRCMKAISVNDCLEAASAIIGR